MAKSSQQKSGNSRNGSDREHQTLYDKYQSNRSNQAPNSSCEGSSSQRSKFPKNYQYPPQVRGFERDQLSLEIMLLEEIEGDVKSIGVVGPPGVGKTTLCKLILKNERVTDSYGQMIWVSLLAPKKKEIEDKEIDEKASEQPSEEVKHIFDGEEFIQRLKDLKEKCLIVLDDVGEGEGGSCYENLKTCFSHGTVIVISRSEEAATDVMVGEKLFHRLMPLSDLKSCWSIYKDAYEGRATPEDKDASNDVMKELMKKCGGLPGAAQMLGKIKKETKEPRSKAEQY